MTEGGELTAILELAADGAPKDVACFFELLLNSKVYVPLKPGPGAEVKLVMLGEKMPKEHNFLTILHEAEECIPIFSEKEFVAAWAGYEMPLECQEFKSLLWLISNDTWMHLNPGQDVGKELTAWELSLLRKGPEAVPELVDAQRENNLEEIEVRSGGDLYPDLKRELLPVLELCEELEEAFLVALKDSGLSTEQPLLGLRYHKVPPGRRAYLLSEIESVAQEALSGKYQGLQIIDDLEQQTSANHAFFEDAKPFYYRPGRTDSSSVKDRISKATSRMLSFFLPGKREGGEEKKKEED